MAANERCRHGLPIAQCTYCRNKKRPVARTARVIQSPQHDPNSSDSTRLAEALNQADSSSQANSLRTQPTDIDRQKFRQGDKVRLIVEPDRVGIVSDIRHHSGGFDYEVFFSGHESTYYGEDKLALHTAEPDRNLSHRDFLRDFAIIKLREPLSDSLYAYQASRTKFRVYQFKPALKFLNSREQRILIADEVGLGKTIEAGIIYLELKARLELERVLVVCPSGLTSKWRYEFRTRFDEDFAVLDKTAIRYFLSEYRRRAHKPSLRAICSLETLRRSEFTDEIQELGVSFDLVIIDEAHHLRNTGTQAYQLGRVLASQSSALVLLTATPLHTSDRNLYNLLHLISPAEFSSYPEFQERIEPNRNINAASRYLSRNNLLNALDQINVIQLTPMGKRIAQSPAYKDILRQLKGIKQLSREQSVSLQRQLLELNTISRVFSRTLKREVEDAAKRAPKTIKIAFSAPERRLYEAVIDFVRWRISLYKGIHPAFGVIIRERQAASCIQALRDTLQAHLEGNQLYTMEQSDSELAEDMAAEPVGREERNRVLEMLQLCQDLGATDSKFDSFLKALRELQLEDPQFKVLVFTSFRGTLAYLEKKLREEGFLFRSLHGDVSVVNRDKIISEFRDNNEIHLMLATEVGAEGLDFQFCGVLFNYDLPWNPMKVEQRIGRLDRFGQAHKKILIYNLVIEDTIETRIFMRLFERIRLFEESVGDIEEILGKVIQELSRSVFQSELTEEDEIRQAEEAASRVIREKLDRADFDREKDSLLGQDEILAQETKRAVESGRFVSPDELRSLVECFVESDQFPHAQIEFDHDDRTSFLSADDAILKYIGSSRGNTNRTNQRNNQFIDRARENRNGVAMTFDPEIALERPAIEFITAHHPLTLAAIDFLGKAGMPAPPSAKLWARSPDGSVIDALFHVYRLRIHNARSFNRVIPNYSLIPIVVELATGELRPDLSSDFLPELQTLRNIRQPSISYPADQVRRAELKAQEMIAETVRSLEPEIQTQNDAMVDTWLRSIEQSHEFRISSAKNRLETMREERMVRMLKSIIARHERELETKRADLNSRRATSVGYDLIASGLVRFSPDVAPARTQQPQMLDLPTQEGQALHSNESFAPMSTDVRFHAPSGVSQQQDTSDGTDLGSEPTLTYTANADGNVSALPVLPSTADKRFPVGSSSTTMPAVTDDETATHRESECSDVAGPELHRQRPADAEEDHESPLASSTTMLVVPVYTGPECGNRHGSTSEESVVSDYAEPKQHTEGESLFRRLRRLLGLGR